MNYFTECGQHACNVFDLLSGLSSAVAVVAFIWAILTYFKDKKNQEDKNREVQENRREDFKVAEQRRHEDFLIAEQRQEKEFEWKRLSESRSFLKEIRDTPNIQYALALIDHTRVAIEFENSEVFVTREERDAALRTHPNDDITKKEYFIRQCYDDFFELIGEVGEFSKFEGVKERVFLPTLGYYAKNVIVQDALRSYCIEYGFSSSWRTLEDFAQLAIKAD